MTLSLVVEFVVAILLIITLTISLVLNRRLGNLRANQEEMRRLIAEFDKALVKARQGMNELKAASAAADTAHEESLKQARALRDELSFMIETADRLADRLAGEAASTRAARQQQAAPERKPEMAKDVAKTPVTPFRKPAAAAAGAPRDFKLEPRSEAERELLMALRQTR